MHSLQKNKVKSLSFFKNWCKKVILKYKIIKKIKKISVFNKSGQKFVAEKSLDNLLSTRLT